MYTFLNINLTGATPSQYGSVFGVAHLAGLISAPVFGKFGSRLGFKRISWLSAIVQGLGSLGFGSLHYCNNTIAFVALSHTLKYSQSNIIIVFY